MNFKKFIKRLNRGIALGIVFALAMTIFVIVDERRFKKEEDNIKQILEDYLDDIAKLNVEVSSIMTPGEKATMAQATEAKGKMSNFLSKYYTSGSFKNVYGFYKQDIESAYNSYLESLTLPIITEQTFSLINNNINIKKYGPGGAQVSYYCDGNVDIKGNTQIFFPGSRSFYSGDTIYYEYNSKPGMPVENGENGMSYDKLYTARFAANGTLFLTRTSDGWKIVMSNGNLNVNQYNEANVKVAEDNSLLLQIYTVPQSKKYIMGGQEI